MYRPPGSPVHINAAGSTIARPTAGVLQAVTVNTKGSSGATLTLYDGLNASGAVLAVIDTTQAVGTIHFNCYLQVGLFAVAAGTIGDVTVIVE